MSKRPSFQFYPPDWRNDPGLRLCSIAARGLWIEMMCLMHDAVPYGHLTVLGRPMDAEALARLVGEGAAQVKRWLAELAANQVYSVNDEGVIFSRRMVRDEQVRNARAAGGAAGAAHGHKGASHGAKGGRPRKEKPPLGDEERGDTKPAPSSSSPSPSPISSDTDVSGAAAPPTKAIDLQAAIFASGVPMLMRSGRTDREARQLIGMWKSQHGNAAVMEALARAEAEGTPDPVSLITAILRGSNGKRTHFDRPSGPIESRRRAREQCDVDDGTGPDDMFGD